MPTGRQVRRWSCSWAGSATAPSKRWSPAPASPPLWTASRRRWRAAATPGPSRGSAGGAGARPLLGPRERGGAGEALAEDGTLVTNNHYSSDMVGFPAEALGRIEPPDSDNRLAGRLSAGGGPS